MVWTDVIYFLGRTLYCFIYLQNTQLISIKFMQQYNGLRVHTFESALRTVCGFNRKKWFLNLYFNNSLVHICLYNTQLCLLELNVWEACNFLSTEKYLSILNFVIKKVHSEVDIFCYFVIHSELSRSYWQHISSIFDNSLVVFSDSCNFVPDLFDHLYHHLKI